ncbi:MAG: T9SS type A sorting domain-containing protein [Flavobacterium circumlabens]|uniref:DUF7619 domain-containing protein n=1 Tax=Flavobacterium circumlabens TaxID=2133765 RepID=UPI003263B9FF
MKKLYLLLFFLFFSILHSQNPAAIDITYDFADHDLFLNDNVWDGVTLPDGKTIIIGKFTGYIIINGTSQKTGSIVRLNPDLSNDSTFDLNKRLKGSIISIGIQSTGKVILAGFFDSYDGKELNTSLIRLNVDGSLDTTFKNVAAGIANKVQVDSNDRLYLIYGSGVSLTRLNPDGEVDSSYLSRSFSNTVLASAPNKDGNIFIAGGDYSLQDLQVYRLTTTGRFDTTFKTGYYNFNCPIRTMAIQSDGKILVGGLFSTYGGKNAPADIPVNHLLRLNTDGSLDTSFSCPELVGEVLGYCSTGIVTYVKEQPDKKILVGGVFPPYNGAPSRNLVRLNSDGSLDKTFVTGTGTNAGINSIILRPNGNMIVCAADISTPSEYSFYNTYSVGSFFELDRNGTLVNREKSSKIAVKKAIRTENGKIALLGESRSPYHRGIKLINSQGTLSVNKNLFDAFDNKKNTNDEYQASSCRDGVIQSDGKLLVIGNFTKYNTVPADGLIRLNSDYSIDPTFSIGENFKFYGKSPEVSCIALQADGKILVGGYFDSYKGLPVTGGIVRLNSNGERDNTFNYIPDSELYTKQIVIQPDGKILINGPGLIRLNTNGTVDTTFKNETGSTLVTKFELLGNGKILVAGSYQLRRLTNDGSIDTSFNTGTFNFTSRATFAFQSDGKILCGGSFNYFNDLMTQRLVRLNNDGTVDSSFNIGSGFNGPVESILIEPDGKIFIAGSFTNYNGTWCNGSVRLLGGDAFLVTGQNKFDSDNNGCNVNDAAFPNLKLSIASAGLNTELIANNTGDYAISLPSGKHIITPNLENPGYFNIQPKNITTDFPSQISPLISNFCITPIGTHPDLEITLIPISAAVPGFTSKYKILYKNKGNQLQSGSVNLTFDDSVLDVIATTPTTAIKSTDNLKWNFTNLAPLESREILLSIRVNKPTDTPPANAGTILKYKVEILSSATDDTPKDNAFTFAQIVINSLDPNDKTCLEGATIQSSKVGEYVHYVIRFENSGTYKAQNITVSDIIDTSKFDINSLIPQTGSHLFITKISEGNKVEFLFEGINLPFTDANNDGYVAFKIKTKSTLKPGDEFSNSSSIYFDYNSAIITNTATTKIEANLSNPDFLAAKTFVLYPNPVNDVLFIDKKEDIEIVSLTIYNLLGQVVLAYPNAKNLTSIDVSKLSSGSYFMKVKSDNAVSNITFIKK